MSSTHAPNVPSGASIEAATLARRRRAGRWREILLAGTIALGVGLLQVRADNATAAGGDYLLVSRDRLMSLPTEGDAWRFIVRTANGDWSPPELDDQDSKTNVHALAAALVRA